MGEKSWRVVSPLFMCLFDLCLRGCGSRPFCYSVPSSSSPSSSPPSSHSQEENDNATPLTTISRPGHMASSFFQKKTKTKQKKRKTKEIKLIHCHSSGRERSKALDNLNKKRSKEGGKECFFVEIPCLNDGVNIYKRKRK